MNRSKPSSSGTRAVRGRRASAIARWHRRVGLGLAALVVMVVLTGLLLNHAEGLGLRNRTLEAPWLYRWYGMAPADAPTAFRAGEVLVGGLERTVLVGESPPLEFGPLVGATVADGLLVLASPDELTLFTPAGELVERVGRGALPPGRIEALGTDAAGQRVLVRTAEGIHQSDTTFSAWDAAADAAQVRWSVAEPAPPDLRERLLTAWRGDGITAHRVVLDVHSGRFFGRLGPLVVDIAALGLLVLVLTGVWSAFLSSRVPGRQP